MEIIQDGAQVAVLTLIAIWLLLKGNSDPQHSPVWTVLGAVVLLIAAARIVAIFV